MDLIRRIEIRGRFAPILRWTLMLALTIVVFGWLLAWLKDDDTSRQTMPTNEFVQFGVQILGWAAVGTLAFSGLLYAISWLVRVRIDENEISGRTYWGLRVRFPSDSVTKVEVTRDQGVRYLWISSSATSRQLCLVLLGVSPDEYVEDLSRILGRRHKLTEWFLENAKTRITEHRPRN